MVHKCANNSHIIYAVNCPVCYMFHSATPEVYATSLTI